MANDAPPQLRRTRERDPRTLIHIEQQAFTEAEAARFIGFCRSYLRHARQDGCGPPVVRIGRQVRYLRSDLLHWLESHRAESATPRPRVGAWPKAARP